MRSVGERQHVERVEEDDERPVRSAADCALQQRCEEVDERQRVGRYAVKRQRVSESDLLTDAAQQRHEAGTVRRRAEEPDDC